jgi:hypothetical protein
MCLRGLWTEALEPLRSPPILDAYSGSGYAVPAGGVAVVTGDDATVELVEEVQALIKSPTTTSADIAARRPSRVVRGRAACCTRSGFGRKVSPAEGKTAVQIPGIATGSEDLSVSDTEVDEMEEHLRGLG